MGLNVSLFERGNRFAVGAQATLAYYGAAFVGSALLAWRNVTAMLGHRSRSAYALTHLAPTKRYQRLA